jgi:nucleoside diphosphate kinase
VLLLPPPPPPPLQPHAASPGHLSAICAIIRARGFDIIAERSVRLDDSLAAALYEQHKGKDFYQRCLMLSRIVFL